METVLELSERKMNTLHRSLETEFPCVATSVRSSRVRRQKKADQGSKVPCWQINREPDLWSNMLRVGQHNVRSHRHALPVVGESLVPNPQCKTKTFRKLPLFENILACTSKRNRESLTRPYRGPNIPRPCQPPPGQAAPKETPAGRGEGTPVQEICACMPLSIRIFCYLLLCIRSRCHTNGFSLSRSVRFGNRLSSRRLIESELRRWRRAGDGNCQKRNGRTVHEIVLCIVFSSPLN
jgi:hypothetical protein